MNSDDVENIQGVETMIARAHGRGYESRSGEVIAIKQALAETERAARALTDENRSLWLAVGRLQAAVGLLKGAAGLAWSEVGKDDPDDGAWTELQSAAQEYEKKADELTGGLVGLTPAG